MAIEAYAEGRRLVAPLMGFPGVNLTGSTIKIAQQNSGEHYKAIKRLFDLFHPDLVFPLMDLSVEANAVGRYTLFPRNDSATVPKDAFRVEEIDRMREINITLDSRVSSYVETVKHMSVGLPESVVKGAYVTGPFSLAGLIMGADEAVMGTLTRPRDLHLVLAFTEQVVQNYARLLVAAGAEVICILEPTAVMLGPVQFEEFSAGYVKRVMQSYACTGVDTLYHVCGNSSHLVGAMAASGVTGLSLDSRETGMDLAEIARGTPGDVLIIGNVNPVTTMVQGRPDDVRSEVRNLRLEMSRFPNYVLSTGCDLPQETPIDNIRAFMDEGRERVGSCGDGCVDGSAKTAAAPVMC